MQSCMVSELSLIIQIQTLFIFRKDNMKDSSISSIHFLFPCFELILTMHCYTSGRKE